MTDSQTESTHRFSSEVPMNDRDELSDENDSDKKSTGIVRMVIRHPKMTENINRYLYITFHSILSQCMQILCT